MSLIFLVSDDESGTDFPYLDAIDRKYQTGIFTRYFCLKLHGDQISDLRKLVHKNSESGRVSVSRLKGTSDGEPSMAVGSTTERLERGQIVPFQISVAITQAEGVRGTSLAGGVDI